MSKQQTPSDTSEKRYRPLGLTIALLATALGYGLIPLLPVALILWSQISRHGVGVDFVGGAPGWAAVVLGVLTLITSVLAWIGRPYRVRAALLILVWVTSAVWVFRIVQSFTQQGSFLGEVGGSLSSPTAGLICQGPLLVLIPLYVTWYLNRAPARQFFRRR
jgi:hypothetical protein